MQPPDFSFEAIASARWRGPSEAALIFQELEKKGVPPYCILLEEVSASSEENAEILRILLRRDCFLKKKVAVMSLLYHLKRITPIFRQKMPEIAFKCAETFLIMDGQLDRVLSYYQTPRGGQEWPIEELLKQGSLETIL